MSTSADMVYGEASDECSEVGEEGEGGRDQHGTLPRSEADISLFPCSCLDTLLNETKLIILR